MGVTATGHVFHESNVAGSKHSPGAITGANLDFAGKMNDQQAFGKRVEVPISGTVKLLHPDLVYTGQCAQFRVLLQTQFLHMAFTVAPRKNSIYSHSAPPYSIARLLSSGLRLVRQTISSAQNSLACHNEGILASGRRIVHRYSSGKSRAASGRGYVDFKLRRLSSHASARACAPEGVALQCLVFVLAVWTAEKPECLLFL